MFQEMVKLLSLGRDVEQIAQSMDLQGHFLEQLLDREEFLTFFSKAKPKAFKLWRKLRDEEQSSQVVLAMAQANAPRNYKALQAIADDPNGELKLADRASILKDLLRMSGVVKEDATTEVVKISAAHLTALREGPAESDEFERQLVEHPS